jgi:hypothetical protein
MHKNKVKERRQRTTADNEIKESRQITTAENEITEVQRMDSFRTTTPFGRVWS